MAHAKKTSGKIGKHVSSEMDKILSRYAGMTGDKKIRIALDVSKTVRLVRQDGKNTLGA